MTVVTAATVVKGGRDSGGIVGKDDRGGNLDMVIMVLPCHCHLHARCHYGTTTTVVADCCRMCWIPACRRSWRNVVYVLCVRNSFLRPSCIGNHIEIN